MAVRVAGGSSTNPSRTWARTYSSRSLLAGGAGPCPNFPIRPTAPLRRIAPDWVCEVLSSSTRRIDLHEKRPIYARENVRHLWFVDPSARDPEAFELRNGEWVLIATAKDDDPVSVPPFDAITFNLGDLWP